MHSQQQHVQVLCRVRPQSARERQQQGCLSVDSTQNAVTVGTKPAQVFGFDFVLGEQSSQEQVFEQVGKPLTEACLSGFNTCILAYGQTGTGKTHTLFGGSDSDSRGLVPRILEELWSSHLSDDNKTGYSVRCSFYEIYNEKVYDLLGETAGQTQAHALHVREDAKRGVFVEGATEEVVTSPVEAMSVLQTGSKNRSTGATLMNRESSRSHAVFSLVIDTCTTGENGVRTTSRSTFSLVDLAGSERQKDTQAEGVRLTEAKNINKSLLTLGNVIQALSEPASAHGGGAPKFVRYRDSTLTFLLRDSLGGNSKTALVAAVSPAADSMSETLSTLKFAQRAQAVRNVVQQNIETHGSVDALQLEIAALRARLLVAKGRQILGSPSAAAEARRRSFGRLSLGGVGAGGDGGGQSGFLNSAASVAGGAPIVAPVSDAAAAMLQTPLLFDGALLSEALERAKFVDEERTRAELSCIDLGKRLAQAETSALQTRMKLKMRESELARLKKGSAEQPAERICAEEALAVEIASVREEMQCDTLKYKLRCEELERRLRASAIVFDEGRELKFQHNLLQQIEKVEMQQLDLTRKFEDLSNERFECLVGFGLDEARSWQAKLEETEAKNGELRTCLIKSQQMCEEKVIELANAKKSAQLQVQNVNDHVLELEVTIAALQREISARKEEELAFKKTEDDIREEFSTKEEKAREAYNSAMKDNMKLLKKTRELEAGLDESQAALKSESTLKNDLQHQLALANASNEELLAKFSNLQEELSQAEVAISNHVRITSNLKALAEKLEEQNSELARELGAEIRTLQCDILQSKKDCEALSFDKFRLDEQCDNQAAQIKSLLIEKTAFEFEAAQAKDLLTSLEQSLADQVASNGTLKVTFETQRHVHSVAESAQKQRIVELEQLLDQTKQAVSERSAEVAAVTASASTAASKSRDRLAVLEADCASKQAEIEALRTALAESQSESCTTKEKLAEIRSAIVKGASSLAPSATISDIEVRSAIEGRSERLANLTAALETAQERIRDMEGQLCKAKAAADDAEDLRTKEQRNSRKLSKALSERDAALEANVQLEIDVDAARQERNAAVAERDAAEADKSRLHAELAGHVNNRQKIQYAQQLKQEVETLQGTVRDKQSQIVQLMTQVDGLHKMLKKQGAAAKEEAVADCITGVLERKAAKRGLAQGKENSLLALAAARPALDL